MTILANGSAPLIRTARMDATSLAVAPIIGYLVLSGSDRRARSAGSTMLSAPARGQLVQGLDRDREANRSIDISFGNLETGAVRDQGHADQQEKT